MKIKVSTVIPMYNESKYLSRCINSLLKQSFKDFEIIFVDDGSTDRSREVVEDFIKKDKRIKLLQQNHGGPGKARNLGASKAKGEILVFVDADMVFDKDYIKNLIKPIVGGRVIGTSHRFEYVANGNNLWARSWSINRIPENIGKWINVFRAIRKSTFIQSGGFDHKKGYFDDDLSKLGKALVIDAVCYHNNPETLKEAFKHSIWVGSSFFKNKMALKNYFKVYSGYLIIGSISILLILLFLLFYFSLRALLIIGLVFIFLIVSLSFKRVINERNLNYTYSIPILTITRLSGYLMGFLKEMTKPKSM